MNPNGRFALRYRLTCAVLLELLFATSRATETQAEGLAFLPQGVVAQQIFANATLASQTMTTYRLITSMSPESLLRQIEVAWSRRAQALIWRGEAGPWKMLSRVVRLPVIEVIQAKQDSSGRTVATLTVGVTRGGLDETLASAARQIIPESARELQAFSNEDPGRKTVLLLARAPEGVDGLAERIRALASAQGFYLDRRLGLAGNRDQSFVGFFARGQDELLVTLDRNRGSTAVVLQLTVPRRSATEFSVLGK